MLLPSFNTVVVFKGIGAALVHVTRQLFIIAIKKDLPK